MDSPTHRNPGVSVGTPLLSCSGGSKVGYLMDTDLNVFGYRDGDGQTVGLLTAVTGVRPLRGGCSGVQRQ